MKQAVTILIVVLGVTLLTTSAVSAEPVPSGTYTGDPAGTSSRDILWSQLDDPTGAAFTDQAFEASYAAYDSWGADDFVIEGDTWYLEQLFTPGSVTVAGVNPLFVNVTFYEDAGGIPGAVVNGCDFPATTDFFSAGDGDITVGVSGCGPLCQGTVWFSQQVRMDFNPLGQHYWATRISAHNNRGVWKNPGNGFGNGCLDWQPANAACGMTGEDWLWELSGTALAIPCGGGAIPAVNPFGVVVMVLALGGGSAYVLRRRRG